MNTSNKMYICGVFPKKDDVFTKNTLYYQ